MDTGESPNLPLAREDIRRYLPHRDPFLFLDCVTELTPGERAEGYFDVRAEETVLGGHFPGRPIWPGVLSLEAMAQLWGVCDSIPSADREDSGLGVFAAVDRVRFRRPVLPGDRLQMEVELQRRRGSFSRVSARARVDGELAAEGILSFGVVE
ncbi:MAG: 3-hydroxyacyl-ACP dehydratase FabZ [Bacillota bacterium]